MNNNTNPSNIRARFARVGKALERHGVQVAVSEPTCCRACAEFPDLETDRPHLVGFRLDGSMNARGLFNSRQPAGTVEWLTWQPRELGMDRFLDLVAEALSAEGFQVEIPTDPYRGIGVSVPA